MKILLVGYGKMGRIIERIALERGHEIVGRIDLDNQAELETADADVAIEFSHPDAAFENIKRCVMRDLPVVSGTTGWLSHKGEIDALVSQRNGAFFYASNYSLGVNIFFKVNAFLAALMNRVEGYDVLMEEIHHIHKKDAPSGTAITLAEGIIDNLGTKSRWVGERGAAADDLVIKSERIGEVPGTHKVSYASTVDTIEIKHTAHSREGFALGAVLVAEWLPAQKGSLNMNDFLKF